MNPQPSQEQIASLVFTEIVNKLIYREEADSGSPHTTAQLVALTYIQDNPGCTIKQLAAGIRVNHSAASQLVHKAGEEGLLDIQVKPEDRRHARLNISPVGRQALQQSRQRRLEALDRILSRMPERERHAFVEGLQTFLRYALSSEEKADDACGRCWVEHFGDCIVNLVHREFTGKDTKRVPAGHA